MVPYDLPQPVLNLRIEAVKDPQPPFAASEGLSSFSQNSEVLGYTSDVIIGAGSVAILAIKLPVDILYIVLGTLGNHGMRGIAGMLGTFVGVKEEIKSNL